MQTTGILTQYLGKGLDICGNPAGKGKNRKRWTKPAKSQATSRAKKPQSFIGIFMPLQVRQIIKTKQCRRAEEKTQIIMNEDLGMTQNAERQQNTFGLWLMMGRADSNRNIFVLNLLFIYVRASEENVCRTAPIGFHLWTWPQGRLLRSRATPTWPSEELRNPHLNWESRISVASSIKWFIIFKNLWTQLIIAVVCLSSRFFAFPFTISSANWRAIKTVQTTISRTLFFIQFFYAFDDDFGASSNDSQGGQSAP